MIDLEPINDDLDVVPHLAIEREVLSQRDNLPIDPGAGETLLDQVDKQIAIFALLPTNDRCEDHDRSIFFKRENLCDDLFAGLCRDVAVALWTVSLTDPCIEHPKVVVNFGNGSDRRTRIPAGSLLRNGNRGA